LRLGSISRTFNYPLPIFVFLLKTIVHFVFYHIE
jgi:hypothetical protein